MHVCKNETLRVKDYRRATARQPKSNKREEKINNNLKKSHPPSEAWKVLPSSNANFVLLQYWYPYSEYYFNIPWHIYCGVKGIDFDKLVITTSSRVRSEEHCNNHLLVLDTFFHD